MDAKNFKTHKKRVLHELSAAGMTSYGLLKMETARLPKIIHADEHIGGVIYGRTTGDRVGSAMLVATDRRIIFIDVKPLFTSSDEVSYDVVAGVKNNKVGPFASVVLHTRVRDYCLRFVNAQCATTFVAFIENHIELAKGQSVADVQNEVWKSSDREKKIDENAETNRPISDSTALIQQETTAVLSTVDQRGNVHGAVIHYVYLNDMFYFVTKSETAKSKNIFLHGQVALTIHPHQSLKTVQISGIAEQESEPTICTQVYQSIASPKKYKEGEHFPPVVNMTDGGTVIIRISPMNVRYRDFSKKSW
jgi:nitroimidazol reductase NimA-like FMN-containing flavoprotein (pyridoxamine 5'-phosphate oxidase superfamily)